MKEHSFVNERSFILAGESVYDERVSMRSQFLMLVCAVSAILSGTALFTAIHHQPGLWLHVIFITSVAVLFWQILGKLRYAGIRSIRQAAKHAHRDPHHQSNPKKQKRRAID